MAYARVQHGGGAVTTTLNGAITSGATSATLTASTGWPDGATGVFYAVIDAGLATEEKILITTRTSLTLNSITRGVDGTSAAAHASGATISHCFTAVEADEANVAVTKTIGLVTTKGDLLAATGSQALARKAAGANNTVLHADSGDSAGVSYSKIVAADITAGTITTTEIADGTITAADLASNAVTTVKITDANVTTAKIASSNITTALIADANVTLAKLAAGLQPVQVCTSGTRPGSPTQGMAIYETDTGNVLYYQGATDTWTPAWNLPWGPVTPSTGTNPRVVTTPDQGSITTVVDVNGCSITFTAVANRKYKHTVYTTVSNNTANNACIILITDGSGTEKTRGILHAVGTGLDDTLAFSWVETGLSAGSTTRKLRALAGGSSQMAVHPTVAPMQYGIDDDGPNGTPS